MSEASGVPGSSHSVVDRKPVASGLFRPDQRTHAEKPHHQKPGKPLGEKDLYRVASAATEGQMDQLAAYYASKEGVGDSVTDQHRSMAEAALITYRDTKDKLNAVSQGGKYDVSDPRYGLRIDIRETARLSSDFNAAGLRLEDSQKPTPLHERVRGGILGVLRSGRETGSGILDASREKVRSATEVAGRGIVSVSERTGNAAFSAVHSTTERVVDKVKPVVEAGGFVANASLYGAQEGFRGIGNVLNKNPYLAEGATSSFKSDTVFPGRSEAVKPETPAVVAEAVSNEAPSMRRGFFAKAKDALTKNPYPAPKGPGVLSSFAAAPLPHTNDFGADLARIRVNSDEKLRSQTEPIIQPESISEQVVVSDASTMAEASSAKGWLARAAERAKAAFPKLPEWNRKDASGVRSAAAEAAAFVAEVLEANKPLQEEVAVAQAVHSYDHAGPAFGLPLFGYERLIESNGFIVDTSGNKVADPVAEDFKKRESLNDRLLNGARTRLNGIVSRFGNKASSVLSVVGRHGARKELTLEEMINDTSHMSKGLREMMAHSKEQVVDTGEALAAAIVDQSVDILSQEENDESKVVVKTGLLRARLSGAFNRAQLEGLHAANTLLANKGKVATLAGGGTLALLALVHPDIFNQMGDLVGSIGHGTLGGGGHHEGILEHARNMPGSEHATNMPGVEHGSSVAGIHVATPGAESLTHISAPNIDPSIHSSLSSPDVSHALNFSDFISQSTDVKPGDSLWTIVSGHAAQSGDWVNSATGVTKGDVLADITRKFIEHSGHGPLVLHPGEAFSISNLNLQQDQLSVLQDAFNTTSSDQYLNEVMPKLNQVLAASR